MFPLRDENPSTVFAWVTLFFIAFSVFVLFGVLTSLLFRSKLAVASPAHVSRLA